MRIKWKIDEATDLPLAIIEDTEYGMSIWEADHDTAENQRANDLMHELAVITVAEHNRGL